MSISVNNTPQERVSAYDVFIFAITVLSLVNLVLYGLFRSANLIYAIGAIDFVISGLFFVDFLRLYFRAENKKTYLLKDFGWADLLASLPFPQTKILRVFRLFKAYGLIKRVGVKNVFNEMNKNRASAAVLLVLFMIILLLEFGSVGILLIEQNNPAANITSASDALWWVYVTITTVGYGDRFPVSDWGRMLGGLVMLVGVGLFGVITAFVANKFLPNADTDETVVAVNKDRAIAELRKEIRQIRELLEEKR